jgi:mono/diheme cytochrome c family protein
MGYMSPINSFLHNLVARGGASAGLVLLVFTCAPASAAQGDAPAAQGATPGASAAATPAFDPRSVFRNICGFCHEDGGRKAAKGPQLMDTQLTDQQVFDRIKFGKPGRMAAFGGAFTDDQIKQIVAYIRALKPKS